MDSHKFYESLKDAILKYISNNTGTGSVAIVAHFGIRCDITLNALSELVQSGIIIKTQPRIEHEYHVCNDGARE